jgi:hypothetical protein
MLEWIPINQESDLGRIVKATVRKAIEENRVPNSSEAVTKLTITSIQR